MSRQGGLVGVPQLFLTQRQHQQLERSFTDPYKRRIAELEEQMQNIGHFPTDITVVTSDITQIDQDCIFVLTWPDGFDPDWEGTAPFTVTFSTELDPPREPEGIFFTFGAVSATLLFNAHTHFVWWRTEDGQVATYTNVESLDLDYRSTRTDKILVFL